MIIIKLEFNKEYTSAELREIFNLPKKTGAMAMKQIEDLSKQYEIEKVKRGYYIIKRELTYIEKLDVKTYNKNRNYIEPMIYAMLFSTNKNSVTMDMHELMEEIEIVNKDFNYIKWHTKECSEIMQQNEMGLHIFTKESEPMLKKIIRDILYDMQDRQLIQVVEIPVIAYKIYDTDTKSWYTTRKDIVKEKEVQELLEIKRKILQDLGVKKESALKYHERSKFRDLIAKEYDGHYFYYKYNIILNNKGLKEEQSYDIIELKKSFNKHIQDKLSKSKQGNLKELTEEEKDIYIKYCIDTSKDYKLRLKKERL